MTPSAKANQLANFPLNFLRTGLYDYSDGKLYFRTTHGFWWSATRSSVTNANYLFTTIADVVPQYSYYRGIGFALRCILSYNQLNEWPLQFLRTGTYNQTHGYISARITHGLQWTSTASTTARGHNLNSWAGNVYAQHSNLRGIGYALRCGKVILRISIKVLALTE